MNIYKGNFGGENGHQILLSSEYEEKLGILFSQQNTK